MKFLSAPIRYQIMMLFGHDDGVCVCVRARSKTRMLHSIVDNNTPYTNMYTLEKDLFRKFIQILVKTR